MKASESPVKDAVAWAAAGTDEAVRWFMEKGIARSTVLEAKPAWAVPPAVFIAMLREQGQTDRFFWVIGGAHYPFDYIDSSAAMSTREAARHFSLKWQLEAARLRESAAGGAGNPETDVDRANACDRLQQQAESLYRLVGNDALWRTDWQGDDT